MVSTAYSAALSGMQAASLQLKISANNISNSNTDGFQTQRVVTQAGTYGVDVKVEKIGTSESQNTLDSNVEKSVNQRSERRGDVDYETIHSGSASCYSFTCPRVLQGADPLKLV